MSTTLHHYTIEANAISYLLFVLFDKANSQDHYQKPACQHFKGKYRT